MILIGLLLILVALAGGAFLFAGTSPLTQQIHITVLGVTVGLPPLSLAVSGALVILVLWLGWAILRSGTKRSARQRRESKEEARLAKEEQVTKERQWASEREQAEQQRQAEQDAAAKRLADQRVATETARQRAEVAERRSGEDT